MAARRMTIAELATSAGLDIDETLVMLWDAELESYEQPSDYVRARDLKRAKRAVGIPTRGELTSPEHWKGLLQLSAEDFNSLLVELGINLSPKAKRLPKGAIRKLKTVIVSQTRPASRGKAALAPSEMEDPFDWRQIGHLREGELRLLTRAEVEMIYGQVVSDFSDDSDPIQLAGVRSSDLLESAVFRQHTSLGTESKYPTVEMAAAALLHSIVHDHPFYDGNKRTALVSMIVLLDENGVMLTGKETELFKFVLRLAQHQVVPQGGNLSDREVLWIADWIGDHSRNVEKGDRQIQWRRLKQILRGFGCNFDSPGRGNRINISRTVPVPRRFGRPRLRSLSTQVKYTDEGREATIQAIKKIRKDLWLDDEHGVDSLIFYRQSGPFPGEFIVRYRKTLRRLARV